MIPQIIDHCRQQDRLASSFITQTVALYMPPQVQTSYDMKYGEAEVGLISEGIKNLIDNVQGGASLVDAVKGIVRIWVRAQSKRG